MPFRQRMQSPVKTDKHELTWSNLAADIGTATLIISLAKGVPPADKNASTECEIGSKVFGIYVEFNVAAETITNPKILHWAVQGGAEGSTKENPSLYYQSNRSFILKRGMEMLPKDVSTVYKRTFVVAIPKKLQRQTADSYIDILFRASSTETINLCGFAIYKEFY